MLMPVFMSNLNPKNFLLPVNFCVLGMGLRALRSITWVKSRNIVVLTIIPKKQSIYVLATISLLSHYHNFLFLTLTNFFSKLYLLIYPEKCILIWINLIWNKYFSIVVFTQLNFILDDFNINEIFFEIVPIEISRNMFLEFITKDNHVF